MLQPGETIIVVGPVRDSGLVDILARGSAFSLFYLDLVNRSELMKSTQAG
jgi:hypothetical protein